jgi:ribonuclease J
MANQTEFSWLSLGGIGEIGKNCYVIEVEGKLLIIDCGMSFPDIRDFGVDVVIPDFSYLVKNQHRIAGIVLTHGHEDHIGSIPFLLQDLRKPPPIYGSKFTLGLLRGKLAEFGLSETPLTEFKPGDDFSVDGIDVQTLRVTHSIPDASSIAVHTPIGIYLHSGDVKIDPTPVDGKTTDFDKLAAIGDQGVTVMSIDTTNIERAGQSGSETSVRAALRENIRQHDGRVFVTSFASNIHRIQQVIDIAIEVGRKVLVLGRTMVDNVAMSQDLGYLKVPPNVLLHPKDIEHTKPNRLLVMLTGSQGEPLAAVSKLANGEHRFISVTPDDLFIFSASPIPGNETAIYSVIDDLFRQGAEVIYGLNTGCHVSGHGNQEEIREYVQIARPKFAIPTHGEFRMQMGFKKIAPQWGIDEGNVPIIELGERWGFSRDNYTQLEHVKAGAIYIAGDGGTDVTRRMINERLALAQDGVLVFSVVLSNDGGDILSGPHLQSKGFVPQNQAPELYAEIKAEIAEAILRNRQRGPSHQLQLRNNVQSAIQRVIFQKTRINPTVLGMVSYPDGAAQMIEQETESTLD